MEGCAGGKKGRVCGDLKRFVDRELALPAKKAVMACEGACAKGEVARVAANVLAYRLERGAAVRICLGDAATADSGMSRLVRRAPEVIAIEGCSLQCGTEILRRRMPDLQTTVFDASALYTRERGACLGILDMPREQLEAHASTVAAHVRRAAFGGGPDGRRDGGSAEAPACREPRRGGAEPEGPTCG